MGCSASKELPNTTAVHVPTAKLQPDAVPKKADEASPRTASMSASVSASMETPRLPLAEEPKEKTFDTIEPDVRRVGLLDHQHGSRKDWKVRPGYSSGASSCGSSSSFEDGFDNDAEGKAACISNKSNILDLGTLKQEMGGDIASNVVRIETPFGKPIEEIYDGVSDGPMLGSGVSGVVRLVTHKNTGIKYAVKVLNTGLIDSVAGLKALRNEIFIMCQLDHPNIVRIEEVYESTDEIYIVQELCLGGDLFDRLDEQPDFHYTEAQCARLVKQMLSAVRYLHSKGIVHRDLKLENFLFSSIEPDSELKMIDFGLSKHFVTGEQLQDKVGTPYTVAPEIIMGAYDEKSDIWAVGVITFLLLSGETPFGGLDNEDLLEVKQNIMRAQVSFEPLDIWDHVSDDGKAFVKLLLQANPQNRPTAKEAQKDDWIQIWAKKNIKEGNKLNAKTLENIVAFKEKSDMQKLLSEVLSFTLLPDQISDLRKEFEVMDTDGDGEISLVALRKVLSENAEAGQLGALTEREIKEIFDSMKTRKHEPTIRWHEFLAAGLSQARVDDRNLRLAFDRLDTNRRGFIKFEDLKSMLGQCHVQGELEKIWRDSLVQCKATLDRITYDDFKRLMKRQSHDKGANDPFRRSARANVSLASLPEDKESKLPEDGQPERHLQKSHSHELKTPLAWDDGPISKKASLAFLASNSEAALGDDMPLSPLVTNRALYRRHRGMRLAVLEASKQFDLKRNQRRSAAQAGLTMKRGARAPVELEDAHNRLIFDAAAKRAGRARRTRNKTVSDVSGLLDMSTNGTTDPEMQRRLLL